MRFELHILGSNAALPSPGRHPAAQVLLVDDQPYLIDCGEGTQMLLADSQIRYHRIGHIFISHLHGDHFFGLIGLMSTYNWSEGPGPCMSTDMRPLKMLSAACWKSQERC
jgi:ribonuclease Z